MVQTRRECERRFQRSHHIDRCRRDTLRGHRRQKMIHAHRLAERHHGRTAQTQALALGQSRQLPEAHRLFGRVQHKCGVDIGRGIHHVLEGCVQRNGHRGLRALDRGMGLARHGLIAHPGQIQHQRGFRSIDRIGDGAVDLQGLDGSLRHRQHSVQSKFHDRRRIFSFRRVQAQRQMT